uniref:Uncharacterized protein n=1 Tax=Ditylum brightwellii TaxID=49249 RepID=A0A7S4RR58_9STRA
MYKGVNPFLVLSSTAAPLSSSTFTTSLCPFSLALIKFVHPPLPHLPSTAAPLSPAPPPPPYAHCHLLHAKVSILQCRTCYAQWCKSCKGAHLLILTSTTFLCPW